MPTLKNAYTKKKLKGSIAITLLLFSMLMMTLFGVFMKYTVGEVSTQEALVEYQQKQIDKVNLKRIVQESVLCYYESVGWNPIGSVEELLKEQLKAFNGYTLDDDGNEISSNETYTFEVVSVPNLPSNDRETFWTNLNTATNTALDNNCVLKPVANSLKQDHRLADNFLVGNQIYSVEDTSKALDKNLFEFVFSKTHRTAAGATPQLITINLELWQVPVTDFQLIAYSMPYTNATGADITAHIPTQGNAPICPPNLRTSLANANAFALVSTGINTNSPATTTDGLDLPYYYRTQMSAVNVVWDELWRSDTGAYKNKYLSSNYLQIDTENTTTALLKSDNAAFDENLFTGISFDYANKKWIVDIDGIDNSITNLVIHTDVNEPENTAEIIQSGNLRTAPLIIYIKHHSLDLSAGDEMLKVELMSDISVNTAIFCNESNLILNADRTLQGSLFLSPNAELSISTGRTLTLNGSIAVNVNNFTDSMQQIAYNRVIGSSLSPYAPRFLVTHTRYKGL